MKAAFLDGAKNIHVKNIEIPKIKEEEILVRINAVGICGSDIHYFVHGRIGSFIADRPLILGHESAGKIVEVGGKAKGFKVGDRVTLEPGRVCGKCEYCKQGRYNLCSNVFFMGSAPEEHGAFVEYIAYDPHFAFKIPENMNYAQGAMIEPLSVAMYVSRRGNIQPGQTVVILGCGPIGLLTLQVARSRGATKIIATDIVPKKLRLAQKLGTSYVINSAQENAVEQIMEITGGEGADVVLEVAGTVETIQQSLYMAKRGGIVVIVGWAEVSEIPLSIEQIAIKELDVRGIFRYANVYPESINLVSAGAIDVSSIITHTYKLEEIQQAFKYVSEKRDGVVKALVKL